MNIERITNVLNNKFRVDGFKEQNKLTKEYLFLSGENILVVAEVGNRIYVKIQMPNGIQSPHGWISLVN